MFYNKNIKFGSIPEEATLPNKISNGWYDTSADLVIISSI